MSEREFQDSHCYPRTTVLVNKLNILDQERLNLVEASFVGLALLELTDSPIEGDFGYYHLQQIHQYLFGDLYNWAGETRTVVVEKYYPELDRTILFGFPQFIESSLALVFQQLENERYLKKCNSIKEYADRTAYYMSEINAVHPFREGNGRTQREFFRCLALENGYDLDWSLADEKELTKARALSVNNPEYLGRLIEKCLTVI